jgi:hypothetical protein
LLKYRWCQRQKKKEEEEKEKEEAFHISLASGAILAVVTVCAT